MEMDNQVVVTIHFRRKEGNELCLDVHMFDDPVVLAEKFIKENSLPQTIISRLIEQIVKQRDEAINQQELITASSITTHAKYDMPLKPDDKLFSTPSFDKKQNGNISLQIIPHTTSFNEMSSIANEEIEKSPSEEYYERIKQLWIDKANTPNVNNKISQKEYSPERNIQILSTENLVKVRSTSAPPSASHFSRNYNTPSNKSPSLTKDKNQPPLSNQEMFNRLHNHANHSKNRLEMLRKRLAKEREDIILSTSFKHNLSQNKRNMDSSNRSRSPSVTRSVSSKNPSSIPLPNQEIFDRLHNVANTSKARLERLKKRIENERDSEVESKMFKNTVSPSTLREREFQKSKSRSLSRGTNFHERLYNHDMQWVQQKERSLSQMREKINREKEIEIEKELTLHPKLVSSGDSRSRSRSVGEVCESLYKFDNIYKNRRRQLEIKTEVETTKENTFIPKISNNSRRLSAHRKNQLSMSTITMSEFGDDFSYFEDKQPKYVDSKRELLSPISSSGYTLQDDDEMLLNLLQETKKNNSSVIFTAKSPLHRVDPSCAREIPDDISHYGYDDSLDLLKLNPQSTNTSPSIRPLRTFKNIDRSLQPPEELISKLSIKSNNNDNNNKNNIGLFSPGSESYGKVSVTNASVDKNIIPRHNFQNKVIEVRSTSNSKPQQRSVSVGSVNRGRSKSPSVSSPHLRGPNRSKSPNPSRLGRSQSPATIRTTSTLGGQKKTLFDKLYEAHWEIEKGKELLKEKYNPSNQSFIPAINRSNDSSNKENKETSSNNGDNKDQFFKRLHDYHNKIAEKRELARKNSDKEMKDKIFHNKVLSVSEKKEMADRLMHSKFVADAHVQQLKYKESASTREQQQMKFTSKKSDAMVETIYRTSLSEIFDALLISVQLSIEKVTPRSSDLGTIIDNDLRLVTNILKVDSDESSVTPQKISPKPNNNNNTSNNKKTLLDELNYPVSVTDSSCNSKNSSVEKDKEFLNTVLAQPQLLRPKLLADTIGSIIKERAPVPFTREKFITTVLKLMKEGSIPVIGYILHQPIEVCNSVYAQKKKSLKSSEEQQLKECTGTPDLAARDMTEKLVKERYRLRHEGRQSIGDSMYSYQEIIESNIEDLKKKNEEEQNKLCPFSPNLISPYFKRKDSNNSIRSSNTSISTYSIKNNKNNDISLESLNNGEYKSNLYITNHFDDLSNKTDFPEEITTFDM